MDRRETIHEVHSGAADELEPSLCIGENTQLPGQDDDLIEVIETGEIPQLAVEGRFLSEGPPSPWDRDVDDTISLLSVALEQAPELDEERVAIVGFSRGGAVGLLTAARDPRIDAVVEFFGLTDLFDEYAREIFEEPWS